MQIYVAFAACPKCLSSHALMLGLMIGNAAMHKPFGIENGLERAAQAVLICGYYIVRQKFLQAKRASFPHRQWTL